MASIKDAYQSTIGESFTGLKLILWAIPLFWFREWIFADKPNIALISTVGAAFLILISGFLVEISYNTIAKNSEIVPGANFLSMGFNGFLGLLATGVYAAICYFGANFACDFVKTGDAAIDMTLEIMIWFIFLGFAFAGYIVFIRRLNVFEAYNPIKFMKAYPEAFLSGAFLVVKLAIINAILVGFISYLFWLFLGFDNYLIKFIWCITIMYNLVIGANYLAQLSEEIFAFEERLNDNN